MGDNSKIEWCDATWNPIRGVKGKWHCTNISEGCRNCYAERMNIRFGGQEYKPGANTFRLDEKILEQPLRWKRPRKIFVCSMTDLFHEEVPPLFIGRIFKVMKDAYWHTFQVLTKRPGRMAAYLMVGGVLRNWPLENVWIGVSVEDQKTADERIPMLLRSSGAVRFISIEPMLGPVNLPWLRNTYGFLVPKYYSVLNWVIVGGESGPRARSMHPEWVRSVRDQCIAAGVPFHFKQWGEWSDYFCGEQKRIGKKATGRLLDGRIWDEWPAKYEGDPE